MRSHRQNTLIIIGVGFGLALICAVGAFVGQVAIVAFFAKWALGN